MDDRLWNVLPMLRQREDGTLSLPGRLALALPLTMTLWSAYSLAGQPLRAPTHPTATALDAWVPFLPSTIWLYLPCYIGSFLLTLWSLEHGRAFRSALASLVAIHLVAIVVFVYFPIASPRPMLTGSLSGNLALVHWLYHYDPPYNTFPSLHVGCSTLCAALVRQVRPRLAWLSIGMAAAIAVSVLTLKQHYAVDVLGGWTLAGMGVLVWQAAMRLDARTVERWNGLLPLRVRRDR